MHVLVGKSSNQPFALPLEPIMPWAIEQCSNFIALIDLAMCALKLLLNLVSHNITGMCSCSHLCFNSDTLAAVLPVWSPCQHPVFLPNPMQILPSLWSLIWSPYYIHSFLSLVYSCRTWSFSSGITYDVIYFIMIIDVCNLFHILAY